MKTEIKNIPLDIPSEVDLKNATPSNSCNTAKHFTWLFNVVKDNAQEFRAYFNTATYTCGSYAIWA